MHRTNFSNQIILKAWESQWVVNSWFFKVKAVWVNLSIGPIQWISGAACHLVGSSCRDARCCEEEDNHSLNYWPGSKYQGKDASEKRKWGCGFPNRLSCHWALHGELLQIGTEKMKASTGCERWKDKRKGDYKHMAQGRSFLHLSWKSDPYLVTCHFISYSTHY